MEATEEKKLEGIPKTDLKEDIEKAEKKAIPVTPERIEGESLEDYKTRRKMVNWATKRRLMGFLAWDSKKNGTFKYKRK